MLYRLLFGLEAIYSTQFGQTLCVSLGMHFNLSEVFYRDLYYISQLFCLMLFEMRDAFSDTMDNRFERKICSWRRNKDLGLCLTTQHIQKMSFGTIMGFTISMGMINLCTSSASPSD